MKLFSLLLVAFVTINVSNAKSIIDDVSEEQVNKTTVTNIVSPTSYITTKRPNGSIYLNMPDRRKKFVINLKTTEHPTTKPANYSNRLMMKKLQIKHVSYNDKAKLPAEITTRRSLMQIRKFTVKPHNVYVESVREKHNWNGNRKISANNFRKPKSERYTTEKNIKSSNEEVSSEQRFSNFKNVDSSINDNDSLEFGKEDKKNSYVAAGSQKIKAIIFPKKNNRKYLKVDPEQKISERTHERKNKISSEVANDPNGNITKDKEKRIIINKVLIKSEPKDNISIQGKADRSEYMFIGVKQKDISHLPADDMEMSTDSDLDFIII